jgi:hypothetical protein
MLSPHIKRSGALDRQARGNCGARGRHGRHRFGLALGGPVLALHFDKMNLAKAQNVNWVAYALPGRFSRSDQARLNRLYGPASRTSTIAAPRPRGAAI